MKVVQLVPENRPTWHFRIGRPVENAGGQQVRAVVGAVPGPFSIRAEIVGTAHRQVTVCETKLANKVCPSVSDIYIYSSFATSGPTCKTTNFARKQNFRPVRTMVSRESRNHKRWIWREPDRARATEGGSQRT